MMGTEERLNARGETLFPGRKRFDRRKVYTHTDGALCNGIMNLVAAPPSAKAHRPSRPPSPPTTWA